MKAMVLCETQTFDAHALPLRFRELPDPIPKHGEILIRVAVCGVCHTELDEIEGRTPPGKLPVVPGHEVVGYVAQLGTGTQRFQVGDRVGVGWINQSSGDVNENLSHDFLATGRDVDGGYAELVCVNEDYAYPIPSVFSDSQAAPLLCAGSIGFRAFRLSGLTNGQRLGLMGFGASAHLMLQFVRHLQPQTMIYVFARDKHQRQFAMDLGAAWAGDIADKPPHGLDAIVDTTPVWRPVIESLEHLKAGGRLVINAIRKEDVDREQLSRLSYDRHLWMEKEIKSVANITRFDIEDFLEVAAQEPLKPITHEYPLLAANDALLALKRGGVRGAHVLRVA